MEDLIERLRKVTSLVPMTASDHEWTELLAAAMDATEELTALREAMARVLSWWPEGSETGHAGKGDAFADDIRHARAILAKQEVEYSGYAGEGE